MNATIYRQYNPIFDRYLIVDHDSEYYGQYICPAMMVPYIVNGESPHVKSFYRQYINLTDQEISKVFRKLSDLEYFELML